MTNEEFQKIVLSKLDNLEVEVKGISKKTDNLEVEVREIRQKTEDLDRRLKTMDIKLDAVIDQTADLTEFRTEVKEDLEEIKLNSTKLEFFTASNWRDIASLKLKSQ